MANHKISRIGLLIDASALPVFVPAKDIPGIRSTPQMGEMPKSIYTILMNKVKFCQKKTIVF